MLNHLLKSEDDDFAPEERIYAEKKGFNVWYILIGILALFPYICIPILFVMVSNIDESSDTNNYYSSSVVSVFSNTQSLSNGKVVSLNSDGEIQLGGGTSIYKNIVDMNFLCPSYLSMDAIYNDTYLISYANKETKNSTLQVVYVDSATPNLGEQVLLQQNVEYYIYEIITLSKVDGIFVGICQDYSNVTETAYIIAGKVTRNNNMYEIKLQPSASPYTSVYSVDPSITRMSDNSFAIVYYNYENSKIETSYGYINDLLEITLYQGKSFLNDTSNGISFNTVGMSPTSYLIFYYNDTYKIDQYYGYGVLNTFLVTVNINEKILLFSNSTALLDSAIVFSLSATMIDSYTAIVAYSDALQNYAVVCQTINLETDTASNITSIVYGSSWKVTSGQTLAVEPSGMMDIDIEKVSEDNNLFMVLFSDISNKGIMTATTGELTDSGEIIRASADFLLNNGNQEFSHYYTWGSLAAGVTTAYSSTTAILTSKTNFDCSLYASTTFSMMEIKPTPYGITSIKSSKSTSTSKNNKLSNRILKSINQYSPVLRKNDVEHNYDVYTKDKVIMVTISGEIQMIENNNPGMIYYSNTMGDLINSKTYVGRSNNNEFSYIEDDDTDTIITYKSKVGFSISSDHLYVQINN